MCLYESERKGYSRICMTWVTLYWIKYLFENAFIIFIKHQTDVWLSYCQGSKIKRSLSAIIGQKMNWIRNACLQWTKIDWILFPYISNTHTSSVYNEQKQTEYYSHIFQIHAQVLRLKIHDLHPWFIEIQL